MKIKNKKTLYWSILGLYAVINLILVLLHEPWRDEIHAWLMAKELSVVDLFLESRFDGHPILWHLLLMPFAKLNFPIITLNMISYLILLISTWVFLFKTEIPLPIKIFAIFTIPFTYSYSAISRNYSCIILLLVLIGTFYPKRYDHPILYSILISLLIHTHSLAWGIVAGLTITFHFYEILLSFRKKNTANLKSIILGLLLIVCNTVLVVFQLFGTSNMNYACYPSSYIIKLSSVIAFLLFLLLLYTIFVLKNNYKEWIVLGTGLGFQIVIYLFVYSSILFQRHILFFAVILFYLILVSHTNSFDNLKYFLLGVAFLFITILTGLKPFFTTLVKDITSPYSSAKEMAHFINENVPKNTTLLIDASVIGQSMIPYLEDGYSFYDISYDEYVTCANVAYDTDKIEGALSDLSSYIGQYLIISNDLIALEDCDLLYRSSTPIMNEFFTLYFVPE